MGINKFEIEDEYGKLINSFNSVRAVEDFFGDMSQPQADRYTVLGFDETGYLIQLWFAADVDYGNFARDVENYAKTVKENHQKTLRPGEKPRARTFRSPRKI